jgi:outer membrane lipoprotein SlyB
MQTVVGIFASRPPVDRTVGRLRALGVASARINVLLPGAADLGKTPLSETEESGVAPAIGAIVGGATGGFAGLAIAGTLMLPGVGIVTAVGLAAAATFSAVGAVAGAALEGALDNGLPVDEVYVYEDALRKGRTVVAVETADSSDAEVVKNVLVDEGAESVDAAREQWWIGLRSAEEAEYRTAGGNVDDDGAQYRRGFEIAQFAQTGNQSHAAALANLRHDYPEEYEQPLFRRGYERGRLHRQSLLDRP